MKPFRMLYEPYPDYHFFIVADSMDDAIAYFAEYSGEDYDAFEMNELDIFDTIRVGYYVGNTRKFDRECTYQEIAEALHHLGEAYLVHWDDIQINEKGKLDLGYLISSARF